MCDVSPRLGVTRQPWEFSIQRDPEKNLFDCSLFPKMADENRPQMVYKSQEEIEWN